MATHVNPDPTLSPARIPIDGMPVVPPEDPPKPMPKLPPEDLPKLPPEDLIPLPCPTPSPAFYLPPGPIPYLPKPFHPDGSEEAGLPPEYLLTQSRGESAIPDSVTMASTEVAPVVSGDNEFVFSEVASESAPDAFEIGDLLMESLQAFLA
jgi:hypothetical protein